MDRRYGYGVIIFLVPFLLAMGSITGNDTPDTIPVTEQKFRATFVDEMDIVTPCLEASINGKTYIEGKKGRGVYTIPFEQVEHITFLSQGEGVKGVVRLKNKDTEELTLDGTGKAYGRTAHGTFQIGITDLKKMIINE